MFNTSSSDDKASAYSAGDLGSIPGLGRSPGEGHGNPFQYSCPPPEKRGSKKYLDFPGGADGKASSYHAGNPGSIPGQGRFPREGNGNPLQYSCLENPVDGGTW